jgi:protein SCO1/2
MSEKNPVSIKKALILFAILLCPSIAYMLLTTGKNNFKHLPIYGPKELSATNDTIYHTVSGFSLINQLGNKVTEKELDGKIYVADFFFASCKGTCPKMTGQLQRVQTKYAALRDLRIVSFSVDPVRDSVPALAAYAKQNMVNPRKWNLLTGDKKSIYDLARNDYYIVASEGNGGPEDFVHSEKVVLVDKEKHIRGYYDGTDPLEIDRLIDEIQVLKAEYHEKEH